VPDLFAALHHPGLWHGLTLLLVGFAGGLFVVNVFVPSGLILAASGALVGAGTLSWTSAVWAGTGVILGCTASYAIGRTLGPRFHGSRFASQRRESLRRAERLFDRFGMIALFAAYFSGPLRGAAPFAAGLARLSFLRFQAVNVASATAWVAATMSPGAVLWTASGIGP